MRNYIIVLVNGVKARFFTVELDEFSREPELKFSEIKDLCGSTQALQGKGLWSTTKPGLNRGIAGQAHSYDDHREHHQTEFERHFARDVTTELMQLIEANLPQQLLLIAEPHIMGVMREALLPHLPKDFPLQEVPKDLCHLTAHELQQYLLGKGLLPISEETVSS